MRKPPKDTIDGTECYNAAPELTNYLYEKLLLETEKRRIRDAGEEEIEEFQRKVRSNDVTKVRILDKIIFPSMANLVFFLNKISKHTEMQLVFENDLKDLLGITRINPTPENYGFVLEMLIHPILNTEGIKDDEKLNRNFRIALVHKIQQILSIYFQRIITRYSPEFWPLMNADMDRILGYTSLISKDAFRKDQEYVDEPHRTFRLRSPSDLEAVTIFEPMSSDY